MCGICASWGWVGISILLLIRRLYAINKQVFKKWTGIVLPCLPFFNSREGRNRNAGPSDPLFDFYWSFAII